MILPDNAVIAREKLTGYLLLKLPENDKSAFLALAGYTLANAEQLEADLRRQILTREAAFMESTEYGDKYSIRGELIGPNGHQLNVVTVWMIEIASELTKFITLYTAKRT